MYGPDYADTDAIVFKNFAVKERMRFQVGASAYNLVNHPKFQNPVANVASSGFGTISSTAIPPPPPMAPSKARLFPAACWWSLAA